MLWSLEQVSQHTSPSSCWVIIQNKVYDVSEFLADHPGGPDIILKYAGQDVTELYEPIHSEDTLSKNLPHCKHLGSLNSKAKHAVMQLKSSRVKSRDERRIERAQQQKPPLSRVLNLHDMEIIAREILPYKALAYYESAADDEVSVSENERAFTRFFFHPRVMRDVTHCDPSTTILGYPSSIPVFVSGSALAKLGHPLGEANIVQATATTGTIYMVSSNASLTPEEISKAVLPMPTLFFQLYKHANDEVALARIRNVERLGYKAIWLTADAVVPGNRERDIRAPLVLEDKENEEIDNSGGTDLELGGTAGRLIASNDRNMTWEKTIPWLRKVTNLPIVIKGIQSVEDSLLAAEAGVDGILLSNHGGRQLDFSMPPIEILYRLRRHHPSVLSRLEVYVDGGIRRGTDVLKALCLGATAVGLGRPFLYAQSAYGAPGVIKIIRILQREIITGMRLLGASTVKDLKPEMVERVDWQPLAARL